MCLYCRVYLRTAYCGALLCVCVCLFMFICMHVLCLYPFCLVRYLFLFYFFVSVFLRPVRSFFIGQSKYNQWDISFWEHTGKKIEIENRPLIKHPKNIGSTPPHTSYANETVESQISLKRNPVNVSLSAYIQQPFRIFGF